VRRSERGQHLVNNYAGYSYRFGSQTCVCNTHHTVKQRLCRWLLTSADRDNSDRLALTETMLAEMIGVRRQSVSEVVAKLQRAGFIAHERNHIAICNRVQLEQLSCDCYKTMHAFYARLVEPLL
jgi:CRP-like cAMP-binding protein